MGAAFGAGAAAALTGAGLSETTLATTIGSLVGMWLAYAVVVVVTVAARGSGRPREDLGLAFARRDLGLGVLAGLVSSFLVVNLVYVVLDLANVIDERDMEALDDPAQRLEDMARGPGFLVLALFVGVGAPLAEELVFRGFLQPAAIRRLGAPAGILLTAVVFGAAHFQLLQFPALAVFGVILGVLAHRSGRLGPAIVAHMVFNGLTLVSLALR